MRKAINELLAQQVELLGLFDGLDAGLHAELAIDIIDVSLDRAGSQRQLGSDLLIGKASVR